MAERLFVGGLLPAIKLKPGVSVSTALYNGSYYKTYGVSPDNYGEWANVCDATFNDLLSVYTQYNSFTPIAKVINGTTQAYYTRQSPLVSGNILWFYVDLSIDREFMLDHSLSEPYVVATDNNYNLLMGVSYENYIEVTPTFTLFIDDNNNVTLAQVIQISANDIRIKSGGFTGNSFANENFNSKSVESEPGPEPSEGGKFGLKDRFSPRINNNGIGVYPLTKSDVISLYGHLWDKTLVDDIKTITGVYSNVSDMILGLKWYYGINDVLSKSSSLCYLTIGNKPFNYDVNNGEHVFPVITTNPINEDFCVYDCGSVIVEPKLGNYLDYTETKYQLYLPFIGYVDMNPNDVVGSVVNVKYNINVITGESLCYITVTNPRSVGLKDMVTNVIPCNVSYDCPITYQAMADSELRFINTFGKAVQVGLSMATGAAAISSGGGAAGTMALANQAVSSVPNMFSMPTPNVERGSGLGGDTTILGSLVPYFMITRPQKVNANVEEMIGRASYTKGKLSEYSGYTKVEAIANSNNVNNKYMKEILEQLQAGVYL